jgi:hypothetical protein
MAMHEEKNSSRMSICAGAIQITWSRLFVEKFHKNFPRQVFNDSASLVALRASFTPSWGEF